MTQPEINGGDLTVRDTDFVILQDAQLDEGLLEDIWSKWTRKKPKNQPRLHIGPCASGAAVVADGKLIEEIKEHSRKLMGIDMEVYGVMHAATNSTKPHPKAFSTKVVCDFGDEDKNDDFQEYAAYLSAEFLKCIALKYF